jgi:hypothetical protein
MIAERFSVTISHLVHPMHPVEFLHFDPCMIHGMRTTFATGLQGILTHSMLKWARPLF